MLAGPGMRATVGWLHLADLHHGWPGHAGLWPTAQDVLLRDLEHLHKRCGPWDLVLISGDLTHDGSAVQFAGLDGVLDRIWNHLQGLGSSPCLLAVPGNHDLVRPKKASPEALLLSRWDDPEVAEEFWTRSDSPYRKLVNEVFAPYTDWISGHHRCTLPYNRGIVPGDFSCILDKDGLRLGVIGLNSAFLDLCEGETRGPPTLDVRQLHAVCDSDGPAWINRCDFALLMTHHPPDRLAPAALRHFHAQIAPRDRFTAHLFGHMHEHSTDKPTQVRAIPGRSLFGRRSIRGRTEERIYGYSAGRISVDDRGAATLRLWPRVVRTHMRGYMHIVQDPDAEPEDDHGTPAEPLVPLRASLGGPSPRPPVGSVRRHLFAPLTPAARTLTVICAPPDFGKTELLDELAARHGERTLRVDANPLRTYAELERRLQKQCKQLKIQWDRLDDDWLVLIDDLHALPQIEFVKRAKNPLIERARVVVATHNPEFWQQGVPGSAANIKYVGRDPTVPLRAPSASKLQAFVGNLPLRTSDRLRTALSTGALRPGLEELCIADRAGNLLLDDAWLAALRHALELP